eukprot:1323546-Amphidinium_carterae.1
MLHELIAGLSCEAPVPGAARTTNVVDDVSHAARGAPDVVVASLARAANFAVQEVRRLIAS